MSAVTHHQVFSAVHTIGGLLPADMLVRIAEGKDVSGTKSTEYKIVGRRSVSDEAERHWDYLKSIWSELREKLPHTPESDTPADPTGLAITQWLAPLFTEFGFGELTTVGNLGISSDDGTKTFPISHRWNHVPIHLVAWQHALDKRPGGVGTVPPQSLVQECLNRTESHLWAVVTNGRQLRLLRDSSALATASYVEFDLEAIFDGELFSEFLLLYRLLHVTRFAVDDGEPPSKCWLERWRSEAINSGTRALDQLRAGVQQAITTLGTGFLRHPDNAELRANLDTDALHSALLRLVYRLLFAFVAEDRDALHPAAPEDAAERAAYHQARERYRRYFSTAKLREHALRRRGSSHDDLYRALRIVLDALGNVHGRPELALPGLGGIFDDTAADAPLHGLSLSNEYLLAAVRHLAQVSDADAHRNRPVDYRHLDAEELGSIYESLLELIPRHSAAERSFELVEVAGNDRKTTGSYYTPSSLIDCLLSCTLDPVLDDKVKLAEQAASAAGLVDPTESVVRELLSLTVCDPACGSGHFLVAAARRIAKRVAAVRESNPEPTLGAVRHALHEVIARCIYGVDLNPMAVELAKVSLWLEALEPGKPLSFLDAHVKSGNALIGATPALLRRGIPDEAFIATEGDDKKFAKTLMDRNIAERRHQFGLFDLDEEVKVENTAFADELRRITDAQAENLTDVRVQAADYQSWTESNDYVNARHLADAWCSAFMWIKSAKSPKPVTYGVFRELENPSAAAVPPETKNEIKRLRNQYRFFHWYLEFPEIFSVAADDGGDATGWVGGFDCVLGNPPWDSVELKEQEFFAQRSPQIAAVGKADTRKKLIAKLRHDPDSQPLFDQYATEKRKVYAESHFLRRSGRVPLTGKGNLNTYAVFCETARILTGARGRSGVIVPTGIGTDARTQYFFKDLVQHGSLAALYDFENRSGLFPAVDSRMKFCVLSIAGSEARESAARFAFFLHDPAELDEPDKAFELTPEQIALMNPNTGTCPVFRSRRDVEITLGIYRRVPVLLREAGEWGGKVSNPWSVSFLTIFHMAHDSRFFHAREELEADGWRLIGNVFTKGSERMLPLYEAKMLHHYDHRWATYHEEDAVRDLTLEEKQDPNAVVCPRYWVPEHDVPTRRFDKNGKRIYEAGVSTRLANKGWDRDWLMGIRKICRATDERTIIGSIFPRCGLGDSGNLILPAVDSSTELLYTNTICMVLDFVIRNKLGGTNLNFFYIEQLPVLGVTTLEMHREFLIARTLELAYTAHDMAPFARDLGETGAPFRWNEERRVVMRAELDALFFHLYEISRDDADYILDTFPIVRRKDEARYGAYRTKELILAEYDRMSESGLTPENPLIEGENYTSTLTPPPGRGPRHPAKEDT